MVVKKQGKCNRIPKPRETLVQLLDAVKVQLPHIIPQLEINTDSRKKLKKKT